MNINCNLISRTINNFRFLSHNVCRTLSSAPMYKLPMQKNSCQPFSSLLSHQELPITTNFWIPKLRFSTILNNLPATVFSSGLKPLTPPNPVTVPTRSHIIIKYSINKGKRRTNKDVVKRFKRLDWGVWIRPKSGARRLLWKKKAKRVNRLKQNVFCNATQSRIIDKMVTSYWRRHRVYADDPYEHYTKREDFWLTKSAPTRYV